MDGEATCREEPVGCPGSPAHPAFHREDVRPGDVRGVRPPGRAPAAAAHTSRRGQGPSPTHPSGQAPQKDAERVASPTDRGPVPLWSPSPARLDGVELPVPEGCTCRAWGVKDQRGVGTPCRSRWPSRGLSEAASAGLRGGPRTRQHPDVTGTLEDGHDYLLLFF